MKKLLITMLLLPGFYGLAQEKPDSIFIEFLNLFPGKSISPVFQEKVLGIDGPFPEDRIAFESRRARAITQQTNNYILVSVGYSCIAGGVCQSEELYSFSKRGALMGSIEVSKNYGDCGFSDTAETAYFENNEILVVETEETFDCEADSLTHEKVTWYHYRIGKMGELTLQKSREVRTNKYFGRASTGLFDESELKELSAEELAKIRNTVFATYGYRFKTAKWLTYFEKKDWYQPITDSVSEAILNPIERLNIRLIKRLEAEKKKNRRTENQR